jgi:hypothetical protein
MLRVHEPEIANQTKSWNARLDFKEPSRETTLKLPANSSETKNASRRVPCAAGTADLPLANGAALLQTSLAAKSLLRLQRRRGNRYVQRALSLARLPVIQRDDQDNDDFGKPAPLVGSDRAIDPKDKICSLTFTLGGPKWMLPNGVSCDPGMFGIPGHGDPFTYSRDQPGGGAAPSGGSPPWDPNLTANDSRKMGPFSPCLGVSRFNPPRGTRPFNITRLVRCYGPFTPGLPRDGRKGVCRNPTPSRPSLS